MKLNDTLIIHETGATEEQIYKLHVIQWVITHRNSGRFSPLQSSFWAPPVAAAGLA